MRQIKYFGGVMKRRGRDKIGWRGSVTRLGKISPLWWTIKNFGKKIKHKFSIWWNFEPTLVIFYMLLANLLCSNRPKLKKPSVHLFTLGWRGSWEEKNLNFITQNKNTIIIQFSSCLMSFTIFMLISGSKFCNLSKAGNEKIFNGFPCRNSPFAALHHAGRVSRFSPCGRPRSTRRKLLRAPS